jgi:SlyX protein
MPHPDDTDARLTELEIKLTLAEDTVDRLNDVVVAQQARLDALAHEVGRLARLLQERSGDERSPGSLRDEVPPHY